MSQTPGGPAAHEPQLPQHEAQEPWRPGAPGAPGAPHADGGSDRPQQPDQRSPQPHQQPAQGTIRLTIQGNELTAGLLTPTVVVSGHRVNSRFGTMDVPVWAGPNRVDIHTTWMRDYGQASMDVVVRPGEVVPVFYAVPWHQFSAGSIGHEKQKRKGLGAFTVFMAALLGLMLVLFVALGSL